MTEGTISYTYDATGAMAEANPLRYRGYYYDRETGFYYLNSRYYDPKIGRFINADSYVSTGQGIVGYNMFAYCGNNPVNREDAAAGFWDTVFDLFSLGASIVDVWNNPTDGWAWAGLAGDTVDLVPFVTGVGEGTKALGIANKMDNFHDATKVGTDVVELSQKNIQHIKKHTFGGMAEQAKYLTDEQLANKLAVTTFFSKNWSHDEIVKYTQEAYNTLRSQGKIGLHSVEINGEIINVFIKNDGTFDSAYGVYRYTVDDFR